MLGAGSVLDGGEFLGIVSRHLALQLRLDARERLALGLRQHRQHEHQPQQRERREAPEYCVDVVRVLYHLESQSYIVLKTVYYRICIGEDIYLVFFKLPIDI